MPLVPISQLFSRYQIPVNLEQHLIQVAALGQLICQNWAGSPLNHDQIVSALLLHDIGNLVKFDLNQAWTKAILAESSAQNPDLPQSFKAWQNLQTQFRRRYSYNADEANFAIVKELKIDPAIINILRDHTFEDLAVLLASKNWAKMILFYCDLRFSSTGLVAVTERLQDLRARYQIHDPRYTDPKIFARWLKNSLALENLLQQHTTLRLTQLTSSQLEPYFATLLQFQIQIGV